MPTNTPAVGSGPIPYVDKVIAALAQVNIGIPIAFELVRSIIGIFRDANPDLPLPTDAEVIDRLRARALEDRDANEQWLRDHGYL